MRAVGSGHAFQAHWDFILTQSLPVIMFPDRPPPVDARDRALLKPLSSLGKSSSVTGSVSFLRRTEYITSHRGEKNDGSSVLRSNSASKASSRRAAAPKVSEPAKKDPEAMLRAIEKSFNLAYPHDAYTGPDSVQRFRGAEVSKGEKDAWERPRHPTKPGVTLLDSYPLIPDLDALPDGGSYLILKYQTNPVASTKTYDSRLDYMLLYPIEPSAEKKAELEAAQEAWRLDPGNKPEPMEVADFVAFLPENAGMIPNLKRKYSVYDADNDSPELYTTPASESQFEEPHFKFTRVRAYETYQQTGSHDSRWHDSVAIALHDADHDKQGPNAKHSNAPKRQKAAYMYPIVQKTSMRPRRAAAPVGTNMAMRSLMQRQQQQEDDETMLDQMEVRIGDPNDEERGKIDEARRAMDPVIDGEE
jgi:RNA polymerase II-associated factor 1